MRRPKMRGYTRGELLTIRNALHMYMLAIDEMAAQGPLVSMRLGDPTAKAVGDDRLLSVREEAESILGDVLAALTERERERVRKEFGE